MNDSCECLEPWYDMYLKYRDSIVLNHNPFILATDDPNTTDQVGAYWERDFFSGILANVKTFSMYQQRQKSILLNLPKINSRGIKITSLLNKFHIIVFTVGLLGIVA